MLCEDNFLLPSDHKNNVIQHQISAEAPKRNWRFPL